MSKELLSKLDADLKLAGYAKRSRQSYVRAVRQLMNFWGRPLEEIEEQQVREYWLHCKDELDWSGATLRISYSGIKFFFQHTLKRDWETLRLLKVQRHINPPTVLSLDEVRTILDALPNPMNQAFYIAVYSLGLRLGEARHLQVSQIDSKRMCVHIKDGKGGFSRSIPMPETTLAALRNWWRTHRNKTWIFPAPGRTGKDGPTATPAVVGEMYRSYCVASSQFDVLIRDVLTRRSYQSASPVAPSSPGAVHSSSTSQPSIPVDALRSEMAAGGVVSIPLGDNPL